ncbi:AAA family ATPase [Photobacterium carnosum]|uniref:AAA family ATPase n=1 Tax=Photobacterium carnosum TaxID=2023717 RepID=UPI001E435A10|nr:AAA family ATPase [Photobacterium carnosum]MCD9554838.1 AAA family ATPase [Photobacterium carnosum]
MTAQVNKEKLVKVYPTFEELGRCVNDFHAPQHRWIVENIIPTQSATLIFAKSGHQKSLLTLDLIRSIATGKEWLNQKTRQCNCLYIDGEMDEFEVHDRVKAMNLNMPQSQLNYYATALRPDVTFNLSTKESRDMVLHNLKKGNYKVVVFDNIRTLLRVTSENDASEFSDFNALITQLRGMGITVIVVHHANKVLKEDGTANYSGSGNIETIYSCTWGMVMDDEKNIKLHADKCRNSLVKEFMDGQHIRFVAPHGYQAITTELLSKDMQREQLKIAKGIMSALQKYPADCRDSKTVFTICRDSGLNVRTPQRLGWEAIYDKFIDGIHPGYPTLSKFNADRKDWLKSHNKRLLEEDEQAMFN